MWWWGDTSRFKLYNAPHLNSIFLNIHFVSSFSGLGWNFDILHIFDHNIICQHPSVRLSLRPFNSQSVQKKYIVHNIFRTVLSRYLKFGIKAIFGMNWISSESVSSFVCKSVNPEMYPKIMATKDINFFSWHLSFYIRKSFPLS